MCIESSSLRIKSEICVSSQEETWQEKRVSEAFSAIQVQLLNKLAVSQNSDILGGGEQFVSKLQFCWVGGNKWKTRSTVDELRVASEGSCIGSPQRRGTVFTGKWKREISILLPPTPRYLECLYADHRKEVFRFFVCCFSDDLKLYLERFFCGRKMTHS